MSKSKKKQPHVRRQETAKSGELESGPANRQVERVSSALTATPPGYLKSGVWWWAKSRGVFLPGVLGIAWLALGRPVDTAALAAISVPTWVGTAITSLLTITILLVDSQLWPNAKAILVFRRLKDPLPGCRAFTKANLDSDPRIDRELLRAAVGGEFPRAPREQNAIWYNKLYKQGLADPVVRAIHRDYLLLRDIAWHCVVLGLLALAAIVIAPSEWRYFLCAAGGCAAAYFLFARGASERGHRFVNQVLVSASRPPT